MCIKQFLKYTEKIENSLLLKNENMNLAVSTDNFTRFEIKKKTS